MKHNRMIHALLAAAVAAGLVLPASAAGTSSFSDVTDPATAVNADILRLMGVADGTGGNRFNPGQKLTRAQFCTMVVNFMGMGDDVVLHSTRTIFTDVPSSHWARGYVNLAASTMLEDGGASGSGSDSEQKPAGTPLISGIGDGRFLPDSQLTYAQAVTILIRVLGYSSSKVGAVWPDGYLNLAQSIGLTDGISAGPNDLIDRAQAAQLFVNALSCETGDGKEYYTTLGSAKEDTILLAVNTETDDGSAMGVVTGESTANLFLPNGGILELKGGEGTKLSNLDTVCTLSAGEKGELYASRISGRNAPGDFDPSSMTLGNKTVSVGVRVYEQVQGAAAQVAVPLSELDLERIPQDKISGYHENSSGIVDLILLDSVTGDAYTYGLLKVSYDSSNEDSGEKGPRQVALENGSGGIAKTNSGYNVKNNSFGGLVLNSSGKIASVVSLDQIDNLSPADFFERDGRYYLSSGGQTYAVSTDVECYNDASETWFTQKTGKERFNACTAFSSDLTAYLDPIGKKVRVLVAN